MIMAPMQAYFPQGFKPLKTYAENLYTRAYPGGIGQYKLGS